MAIPEIPAANLAARFAFEMHCSAGLRFRTPLRSPNHGAPAGAIGVSSLGTKADIAWLALCLNAGSTMDVGVISSIQASEDILIRARVRPSQQHMSICPHWKRELCITLNKHAPMTPLAKMRSELLPELRYSSCNVQSLSV